MIKELQEFTEAQKTISKYNNIFIDMVKDFTATWRANYWFERIEIDEDKCTVWCDETIMGDTETVWLDIPTSIIELYVQGEHGKALKQFSIWWEEEKERKLKAEEEQEKREEEEQEKAQYQQYLILKEKFEKKGE